MIDFDLVWERVPEGLVPADFAVRRAFLLGGVRPGDRVLDVGCGEGAFTAELAAAGARPLGVEVAAEPLRRARSLHPELDFRLLGSDGDCGSPGSSPAAVAGRGGPGPSEPPALARLPAAHFDVVWAGEVIEHVADGVGLLDELRRALRPGGRLLLSTPDHPRRLMWTLTLSARAFERHFDPRSDHLRFFTRRTLGLLLEEAGFSPLSIDRRRGTLLARAER